MSNFTEKDLKEENRKLRQDSFKKTEKLTRAINIIEDTSGVLSNFLKLDSELKAFLKEVKGND